MSAEGESGEENYLCGTGSALDSGLAMIISRIVMHCSLPCGHWHQYCTDDWFERSHHTRPFPSSYLVALSSWVPMMTASQTRQSLPLIITAGESRYRSSQFLILCLSNNSFFVYRLNAIFSIWAHCWWNCDRKALPISDDGHVCHRCYGSYFWPVAICYLNLLYWIRLYHIFKLCSTSFINLIYSS